MIPHEEVDRKGWEVHLPRALPRCDCLWRPSATPKSARAPPRSGGAGVAFRNGFELHREKKNGELHLKKRPRRAFGKRPPEPGKPKENQAGHSPERAVEGQRGGARPARHGILDDGYTSKGVAVRQRRVGN